MGKGLIIGYDLLKDYCRISWRYEDQEEIKDLKLSDSEDPYPVKNSICKKKGEDTWLIGGEAYQTALFGSGTIVDKVLRLVSMGGHATFEGITYDAEELLGYFLRETLAVLYKEAGTKTVNQIVFTVQHLESRVIDAVIRCARSLGIEKKRIHVISHTEAFLHFVLSEKRELWTNMTVLFDLSQEGLNYYSMEVMRGIKPNIAKAERAFLEECFSPDILDSKAGQRMADNIMANCVERVLANKTVSSAYLSGLGMNTSMQWGNGFLKILCQRRRVFYIDNLFARGAVLSGNTFEDENAVLPYSLMCEGRIDVDITVDVIQGVQRRTMILASAGSNWFETKAAFDFIPDDESSLKLTVKKLGESRKTLLEVPFEGFEFPGNKLKRIGAVLAFTSGNSFDITLKDKGFGEFFPASDVTIRRSFVIE